MGDTTLSGYKASATSIAWTSGQALDSAADNEYTDLSDEIDNTTNKYIFHDVRVALASAAFTGTDSAISLYLVPSVDGTNFAQWTGNVTTFEQENENSHVDTLQTSGATEAQEIIFRDVKIPNGKFKYAFRNKGGVSLAGSGNSAQYRPHQFTSA